MADEGEDRAAHPCRGGMAELEAALKVRKEGRVSRPIEPASLFLKVMEWASA